jgi:hypothetical protein
MKHIKRFDEVIKVDIKVGDTVLGGRFKNKKTLVKKIGKNKKGDITINDKPLLKYRIIKEDIHDIHQAPNDIEDVITYYLSHLIDDGFIVREGEGFIRIHKPKYGDFYAYTNLTEFNFSEIAGDVIRFVNSVDGITNLSYMTIADDPREVVRGGMTFTDQLDRNILDIEDMDEANMDMYSLTILF